MAQKRTGATAKKREKNYNAPVHFMSLLEARKRKRRKNHRRRRNRPVSIFSIISLFSGRADILFFRFFLLYRAHMNSLCHGLIGGRKGKNNKRNMAAQSCRLKPVTKNSAKRPVRRPANRNDIKYDGGQ